MQYGFRVNTITLKDVPATVHSAFKSRAKANGRSLNKEIIVALEGTLHSAPMDAVTTEQHARAVRKSLGVYLTQKDLSALKTVGRR